MWRFPVGLGAMRTLTVTAYYDRVPLDCKWLLSIAERLDS
jgi:hypothetical protein